MEGFFRDPNGLIVGAQKWTLRNVLWERNYQKHYGIFLTIVCDQDPDSSEERCTLHGAIIAMCSFAT